MMRQFFRLGFLAVLTPLFLVGLMEGALRLSGVPPSYSALFVFDERLGYRLVPGDHAVPTGDAVYRITVDGDGLVDRAGDTSTGADILILGDGVVAGFEVPPAERLATRLSNLTGTSVANLSSPGYGTVQQALILRDWLAHHRPPQTVVVVFNLANDYYDNVPAWEGPRVPGIRSEAGGLAFVPPQNPVGLGRFVRAVLWNSRAYALVMQWKNRGAPVEVLPGPQAFLLAPAQPEAIPGDTALALAAGEIEALAAEKGFDVRWLLWNDRALVARASGVSAEIGRERAAALVGGCWWTLPEMEEGSPEVWETRWLSPDTRHAGPEAMGLIAEKIADGLARGSDGCGRY